MKHKVLIAALLMAATMCGCGNDEPKQSDVVRVEVEYTIDFSGDLYSVLNMQVNYMGNEGVELTELVNSLQFKHKAVFTKFPNELGMKLLALSVKEEALTKDKYLLRLTYTVSAISYDKEGNVVQNCPNVDGATYSTTVGADKIKSVLDKDVEKGEYFSTSTDIDKKGKIIASAI